MLKWLVPLELVSIVGLGYAIGVVGVAVAAGILGGLGVVGGAWLVLRMDRSHPKG
jgi:Na+-driven multidrug efflux pump